MKMTSRNSKWIIPALSLLVIFESVFIVKLVVSSSHQTVSDQPVEKENTLNYSAKIALIGNSQVDRGEVENLQVVLTAEEELILDGVDVYLRYDSAGMDMLTVVPTDEFSIVGRNWIEPENERILISLIEPEENNQVRLTTGQKLILADISYQAVMEGMTELKIVKSGQAKGTILAGQGEKYDFITEDLAILIE